MGWVKTGRDGEGHHKFMTTWVEAPCLDHQGVVNMLAWEEDKVHPVPQPPDHLAVALSHREIFTVSKSDGTQSSTARKGRQGTVPGREFALHQANAKVCNLLLTAEEE